MVNSGGHRIGWAFKTTNMKRLGVDPPCGVLDPKEAILVAVSCDAFAYGLPAGLIDDGEDVDAAALRELREETGVEPIDENSCDIDHVGQFYSSEGMTDELANIMVVHLRHWQAVERHFDADEHVESAWIPWKQLRDTHITASNSEIAILHEQIRRMRQQ